MDNSYIILRTYAHLHQAEQDLNTLKSKEIDAYLTDKIMGGNSFLGAATGGIKIHVAKNDVDRAREILSVE